ncbi:PaaX family transcriptional regulator C-terminal domain-containing protein [Streptomyces sp. R21]|uniref:PaaX family transcriptional regulator C-terminal domain-containing protein n=1 Tax=Streptomyces sp. R21 TaxID=3238627 RepID=A0AB39P3W5_9ACTN
MDSPIRPSSLINTVYGAFVRGLGGWISIASLIVLMGELDVDSQAVRSAISRLKKRGVLVPERRSGTGYSLSPAMHPVFDEGDRRIFESLEPAALEDGWVMAVFSVPESERTFRYQLRTRLTWLGFGNMAPGVWLAPARLLEPTRATLERLGLSDYVHLFASRYAAFSDLRTTVSTWWDFPAIEAQYADFTDTYLPVLRSMEKQKDIDAGQAFRHYVPMVTQWRRLPYLDPGLPAELLPDDWNAVAARQLFQQLHGVLAAPSLEHVRKVTSS